MHLMLCSTKADQESDNVSVSDHVALGDDQFLPRRKLMFPSELLHGILPSVHWLLWLGDPAKEGAEALLCLLLALAGTLSTPSYEGVTRGGGVTLGEFTPHDCAFLFLCGDTQQGVQPVQYCLLYWVNNNKKRVLDLKIKINHEV